MLRQISCDKFMSYGESRPPIDFKPGLNTIVGGDAGENSIGKSTLLMIIDFVFGGSDYTTLCEDVMENVKHHTIKWEFEFDGVRYHFSRSTEDPKAVSFCDERYEPQDEMSVRKYCEWLQGKYELELPKLSFREAVSRYVRVKQRGTINVKKPLMTAAKESEAAALRNLLKLFERYTQVAQYDDEIEEADSEKKAIEGAAKYHHIAKASGKREAKAFAERVAVLEGELEELTSQNESGTLDFESLQTEQVTSLTSRCSTLKRQRTDLQSQLDAIRYDRSQGGRARRANFEDLRRFFPNANLDLVESIEDFHRNLAGIMKEEFKATEKKIEQMIDLLNGEIADLESQISEAAQAPNLSQSIIIGYSVKHEEMTRLKEAIATFEREEELREDLKAKRAALNEKVLSESEGLQKQLNDKMGELNRFVIVGRTTQAPVIKIEGASNYSLYTPNDLGDGTADKALILFDVACLEETRLPFIAHDSSLFAQIEYGTIERILELYAKQAGKQVFVTLDKERTYTERTQDIISQSLVLRLDRGGNELFGWSWNLKTEEDPTADKADR